MVSLPESSSAAPDGWPPRPGPKLSPVERRKRRETVETLLVDGLWAGQIQARVSAEFGVSARQVRDDIAHVQRQWDIEDRRHASRARQRVLKRLQRHARRLEESGKHAAAALVDYRIGRLRGMGSQLDVEVNVRGRVVHQHLPADPTAWLQAVLAGFAELGLLPGGSPVGLPGEVVRVETNGHNGNGSNGNGHE